jgi:hypothetical protein
MSKRRFALLASIAFSGCANGGMTPDEGTGGSSASGGSSGGGGATGSGGSAGRGHTSADQFHPLDESDVARTVDRAAARAVGEGMPKARRPVLAVAGLEHHVGFRSRRFGSSFHREFPFYRYGL